jgi:hypothetical protein
VKRALLLLAGLAVSTPVPATAAGEDTTDVLYERAVSASQEGRHDAAATLFDEVLGQMAPNHPLRALALYGAARANQRVGTADAACKAVERYKTFIGLPDAEPEKREKAAKSLGDLLAKCASKDAVVPAPASAAASTPAAAPAPASVQAPATVAPPPAPDRTWAWVATGAAGASLVGGALLLVLADAAIDDGDAAMARFEDSGRTSVSARDAVRAADDRVVTYANVGYGVLGLGAALGGLATWLWVRDPGAPTAWAPTPNGMIWTGRF